MNNVVDLRKLQKQKPKNKKAERSKKIKWTTLEFEKHEKGKKWFIFLGLISLVFVIIAAIFNNFLLSIIIILATFILFVYAKKEPRKINFIIDGRGIKIDNKLYKYKEIKSFWMFYEPPEVKELSIRSNKAFMPYIKIPLSKQNPAEIRRFLLRFLPEREHRESIIEAWMRRIRF